MKLELSKWINLKILETRIKNCLGINKIEKSKNTVGKAASKKDIDIDEMKT